jgi:hypothetical protein
MFLVAGATRNLADAVWSITWWPCRVPSARSLDPVWSKISNALKRLGFRSHNFLAQLLSETCGWRIVVLPIFPYDFPSCYDSAMSNLVILLIHFLATLARLLGPGGVRSIVAESLSSSTNS